MYSNKMYYWCLKCVLSARKIGPTMFQITDKNPRFFQVDLFKFHDFSRSGIFFLNFPGFHDFFQRLETLLAETKYMSPSSLEWRRENFRKQIYRQRFAFAGKHCPVLCLPMMCNSNSGIGIGIGFWHFSVPMELESELNWGPKSSEGTELELN